MNKEQQITRDKVLLLIVLYNILMFIIWLLLLVVYTSYPTPLVPIKYYIP